VGGVGEEGVQGEGVEVEAGGGERAEEEMGEVGEQVEPEEAAVEQFDGEGREGLAGAEAAEEGSVG
jgi:hypothetical protein